MKISITQRQAQSLAALLAQRAVLDQRLNLIASTIGDGPVVALDLSGDEPWVEFGEPEITPEAAEVEN